MTVGEAFLVSNLSREASSIPYTALWGLSALDITPRKGMEQMNQKARQPGFMHASLLQFFAEGVDPFLRVKATAEVELNKANKKHTAIIDEVEASIKTAEETANNSYGWAHRPGDPEGGIPAWDLTQNVPADVYTHPHYYSDMSEPSNQEAHRILGRIRNNPEAKVHIYRSLPAEEAHHGIKPGDWVSISRDYARQHGKQEDPKDDWPVIRATVKAKDLFTDADDFRELGFWGEKPVVHGIHFKGGKNQEVSVRSDGSIRAVQRRNQTQASVVDFFHQAADNDLLQHFGSEEDPFLTMKKQEEAKLRAGSNGKPLRSGPEWDQYIETMRKAPHPKNVEYKFYHDKTFLGTPPGTHAVIAHHDGKEVGHLYWADDNQAEYPDDTDDTSNEPDNPHIYPGDIYHIQVHAPYQRHGIATTILQKAHEAYASGEATTKPVHVDDLSKDAEAWINSLPTHLSLLQHFGSEEDPFLTVKKQEDARLQNAIDKHEDEKEKSTSPNASEKLQQKIHEANETYKENMSNAPHPQNVEYRWMEARGGYGHQITAHHNGEQIGRMEWTPQKDRHQYTGNHFPGEIQWIEVDEPYQSHGIATTMLTKAHEAYQAGLADSKPQHSDIKTDEGQAWHDHLVKTLHPHASKNATVLNDKRPNQRLFAPTLTNLDPRLFDGERLRPEIRETIMNRIAAHWDENYKNWREWSRVYLAGSAVSHWWADYNAVSHAGEPGLDYHLNDDLDTLIGIEYGGLLENHPEFLGVPARVISAELNKGLRENCNLNDIFFEVPSAEVPEWEWADTPQNGKVKVGPWSATFYVNPNSYDIRVIKPYAAYDLTNDEWAVKPVEAAEGHNFTPTEWYYFEGVAAEIMATLQLPEPARSNKAKHLWEFIHTNRNKAFRPDGQGVFDYRNVVEKYLDQLGLWQPLVNARFGVNKKEGVLLYGHEKIKQRYVEEGSYFYGAKNKNRKNAPQPGDGIAGSPSGSPSDDSILGDQEKTQPVINSHPKLSKDFGKMSIGDKKRANETIEKIANGDVEGLDTHPIRYGAMSKQKPYWLSTPFGRGMRVVHRKEKDNSLTILYAGKHEYDEVVRRATGVQNV